MVKSEQKKRNFEDRTYKEDLLGEDKLEFNSDLDELRKEDKKEDYFYSKKFPHHS